MRDTALIAAEALRGDLRSTRMQMLVGIYVLLGTLSAVVVTRALGHIERGLEGALPELDAADLDLQGPYSRLLEVAVGDPEQALFLAGIAPGVLLFFLLNHAVLPWFALLVGYDAVAASRESGAIRFVLLRTSRRVFLGGRLLAGLLCLLVLTTLGASATYAYGVLFTSGFDWWRDLGHLLRLWVFANLIGAGWLAFVLFLSTVISGRAALLVGAVTLLATSLLGWMSSMVAWLAPLATVLPGQHRFHFLSHRPGEQLLAGGALLAFFACSYVLAAIAIRRRGL